MVRRLHTFGFGHDLGAELVPVYKEAQGNDDKQHRTSQVSPTPTDDPAQTHHKQGRYRPTQITREPVYAECMAQARLRYTLVQNGEVNRVKRRIAQAKQHCGR